MAIRLEELATLHRYVGRYDTVEGRVARPAAARAAARLAVYCARRAARADGRRPGELVEHTWHEGWPPFDGNVVVVVVLESSPL